MLRRELPRCAASWADRNAGCKDVVCCPSQRKRVKVVGDVRGPWKIAKGTVVEGWSSKLHNFVEVGNIWKIFLRARRIAAVGAAVRLAAKGGLCGGPKSAGDARKAE